MLNWHLQCIWWRNNHYVWAGSCNSISVLQPNLSVKRRIRGHCTPGRGMCRNTTHWFPGASTLALRWALWYWCCIVCFRCPYFHISNDTVIVVHKYSVFALHATLPNWTASVSEVNFTQYTSYITSLTEPSYFWTTQNILCSFIRDFTHKNACH